MYLVTYEGNLLNKHFDHNNIDVDNTDEWRLSTHVIMAKQTNPPTLLTTGIY